MVLTQQTGNIFSQGEVDDIRKQSQVELMSCSCVADGQGVKVQWRTYKKKKYYFWLRIPVSMDSLLKVHTVCNELDKRRNTSFSMSGLYRAALCPQGRPERTQQYWFCSQLVGFVLQYANVLPDTYNVSALHPNEIFLLCHFLAKGEGCEHPLLPPGKKNTMIPVEMSSASATGAYCWYRGLDRVDCIPNDHLQSIAEVNRVENMDDSTPEVDDESVQV